MNESYVEYLMKHCSDRSLSRVCEIYKTRDDLISDAKREFNGTNYILGQKTLIQAACSFISENGYLVSAEFGKDAMKVFRRFQSSIMELKEEEQHGVDIDGERMFNSMTDLNWLLSSKYYHIQNNLQGKIELIPAYPMMRIWLRKALNEELYKVALYDRERCYQYSTAQLVRYQFFSGCHPDAQVRNLYAQGYTGSDFKILESQAREHSIAYMALYYGMTVTAARVEEIRRTLR